MARAGRQLLVVDVDRETALRRRRCTLGQRRSRPTAAGSRRARRAAVADGFSISRNRSKNEPVEPSARNHSVAGAVTPALSWPAPKAWPGRFRYIARSTTIGCVEVTTADTSVLASSGVDAVDRDGQARARRQRVGCDRSAAAAPGAGTAPSPSRWSRRDSAAGRTARSRLTSSPRPDTTSSTATRRPFRRALRSRWRPSASSGRRRSAASASTSVENEPDGERLEHRRRHRASRALPARAIGQLDFAAAVRLDAQQDARRRIVAIEERDLGVEEGVGGALGEVPPHRAARMRCRRPVRRGSTRRRRPGRRRASTPCRRRCSRPKNVSQTSKDRSASPSDHRPGAASPAPGRRYIVPVRAGRRARFGGTSDRERSPLPVPAIPAEERDPRSDGVAVQAHVGRRR